MPCFKPLTAYRSKFQNANGKRPMVFDHAKSLDGIKQKLPCGKCIGCRIDSSATWAGRIMNESQMHADSIMATLTYSNENLPDKGCIQYSDMQKFYKRLRKKGYKVRHFTGSEYGDLTGRPHYHAIIFGFWPEDAKLWGDASGNRHYTSEILTETWGLGHTQFTEVNFETAQYVANYCTKKITGELANDHYMRVDPETGEVYWLPPEQGRMSRRPGIGKEWLDKYKSDVFPRDEYMPKPGVRIRTPKYYTDQLEKTDPALYVEIKNNRKKYAASRAADTTPERLKSRETVAKAKRNLKMKKL